MECCGCLTRYSITTSSTEKTCMRDLARLLPTRDADYPSPRFTGAFFHILFPDPTRQSSADDTFCSGAASTATSLN